MLPSTASLRTESPKHRPRRQPRGAASSLDLYALPPPPVYCAMTLQRTMVEKSSTLTTSPRGVIALSPSKTPLQEG